MLTRNIARAVVGVLQRSARIGLGTVHAEYPVGCIAAQLRQRGITVRIDAACCEMVLGSGITLPLYPRNGELDTSLARQEHQAGKADTLMVRAVDLAAIPYRYCFGEAPGSHARVGCHWRHGWPWPAAGLLAWRAWWRLVALLTPTPREVIRAFRAPWHPATSGHACDGVVPGQPGHACPLQAVRDESQPGTDGPSPAFPKTWEASNGVGGGKRCHTP